MVGFPLLLIPIAIYNIVAWLMPDVPLTDAMFRLRLFSGAEWAITLSDILLALGVLLLLLEIMKGARPGSKYLTDHLLSFVLLGAVAAEFVMWPKFGTSTFFLLTLMAMVDFFGGVALHTRRRAVATPVVTRRATAPVEPASPEPAPRVEPAPVPPEPTVAAAPAASVAEAVLQETPRPAPTTVEPIASVHEEPVPASHTAEPLSRTPSPDLQSHNGPEPPRTRGADP